MRRFTTAQKREILMRAKGKCERCGVQLTASWHADHIVPYVLGGRTELKNAQALCPKCNLTKH
jgi:5-methylcytosine-specific restriction endonuclease McrA